MADRVNASQGAAAAPTANGPGLDNTLAATRRASMRVVLPPPEGTTVCDFDEAEIRQQRSVGLAVASLAYDGIKVNLVDTPGYADFVGELWPGCGPPIAHCS